MDQTATFLLPCPQEALASSAALTMLQGAGSLVPPAAWTGGFLTKSPPQGRGKMQDRELVTFLKDGHPSF